MPSKKEINDLLNDPKAVEYLKTIGFVKRRRPEDLVAKTFKLPKDVIEEFYKVARERDLKIQDAVEQALAEWVSRQA